MSAEASPDVMIADAQIDGADVVVRFGDGSTARFNRFWLRDHCTGNGERESLFRDFSAADLPDGLRVAAIAPDGPSALVVTFSDGTTDTIASHTLRRTGRRPAPMPTWRAGHEPVEVRLADLEAEATIHLGILEALARDGVALVTGAHDTADTETIAAMLGPIRETDFGRVFDIVSDPDPFTPSQSIAALDPHTDDPYRYTPAGISVLHCIAPSGHGGDTVAVDGFAIAESLRAHEPNAFATLTEVAVPFVHRRSLRVEQGDDVHLRAVAPIIAVDHCGHLQGIRFHERSMGSIDPDPDLAESFYPALARFARAVRSPQFQWRRHLATGDAILYDNQRVLHGRTEIAGTPDRRHLRLCTVDREMVHSRLRRLREIHATGTECDPLPAGNLA